MDVVARVSRLGSLDEIVENVQAGWAGTENDGRLQT